MQRGEIWWAELPVPIASEPGDRRPVLIIQADQFNFSRLRTIACVTLTTTLSLATMPGNVFVSAAETGLPKDSVINVTQIVTADRSFFTQRVGELSDRIMLQVEAGLRLVLALE